jgi:hypothetical protein
MAWRAFIPQRFAHHRARLALRSNSLCDGSLHTPLNGHPVRQARLCRQLLRVGKALLGFDAGGAFFGCCKFGKHTERSHK